MAIKNVRNYELTALSLIPLQRVIHQVNGGLRAYLN